MKKTTITLLTSIALLSAGQYAISADEERGSSERRGPPPEALAACEGKSVGEVSEFTSPRGVVSGTCEEHDGQMILRPDNPRDGGENGDRPTHRNQ